MPDAFTFEQATQAAPAAGFSFEEANGQPAGFSFDEAAQPAKPVAPPGVKFATPIITDPAAPPAEPTLSQRLDKIPRSDPETTSTYLQFMHRWSANRLPELATTPLWNYIPEDIRNELDPAGDLARAGAKHPEAPEVAVQAGIAEGIGNVAKGFTSPIGIATLGMGALPRTAQRVLSLMFAVDMARHTPELARELKTELDKPTGERDPGTVARLITEGTANSLFTVLAGTHGLAPARPFSFDEARPVQAAAPSPRPVQTSEFAERPGADRSLVTLPEQPETIAAQMNWLQQGKRAAVLLTPGVTAPAVPEGLEALPTEAGTFLYDPAKLQPAEIHDAVANDRIGRILGYGIDNKPAAGAEAGVVTIRNEAGTEKQAVVTDAANAEKVAAAARAVADPGDTVQLEPAGDVLAGRLQRETEPGALTAIERKVLSDGVTGREPLPAALVDRRMAEGGFALPEGYGRQGDQYIYREPEVMETPAQRQAREREAAVAALRAQPAPAAEPFSFEEADTAVRPTERVEPGVPMQTFERPPDIIDAIEEHFPGVRVPDTEDFADVRERLKGLRQSKAADLSGGKLKRLFRGEAPDTALQQLHAAGAALRIQSGHELLHTMVDAAKQRIAWAEQEKAAAKAAPAAPTAEEIDPWQATIDTLNSLKVDTKGQLHAFGLVPEAWNGLIELVKLGVRSGKAIAEAIDWAIDQFKTKFPDQKFDEGGAREQLNAQFGARATGEKIAASPAVNDQVKDAINQYLYEIRTNATDQQLADGILQRAGVDGALEIWRRPPADLPGSVRSKLLRSMTQTLAEQERQARSAGDTAAADQLANRQADIWNEALPAITDMAQSLQALNDLVEMSPEGQVARVRKQLEAAADDAVARRRPETEQIREALQEGKREGVQALKQDEAVNTAARHALDDVVRNSDETKRAVIMELAEPWAESPEIVQMVREQVREKAIDALNKSAKPAGLQPQQYLRQLMDDLAKRAAGIFAGHIQGADPGTLIVDKFVQRLGLTRERAQAMATAMSKEWDRQLKAAQAALPRRLAKARAARQRAAGELPTAPTSAVDAALRRQLGELNLKLGDVLRSEVDKQDATGRHVAERIVQASGLTGEHADTLRNVLENRWNNLITAAQRQALERIQARTGVKVSAPLKSAFEKLVEYDRLGGLSRETFFDTIKQSLKLKRLNQADAAELRRLVRKAQAEPEGFLRQRAAADVVAFTERLKGNVGLRDVPMAMFYANILSGFTTPAKIILENTNLLVGNTIAEMLGDPRNFLHPATFGRNIAGAWARGLAKGALQAEGTLRTGKVTGIWPEAKTNVLEMQPFGPKLEPFNIWKYFGRVIGTAHETTFKPAWEIKQTLMAQDIARREGLRGRALQQRVADLLANTPDAIAKAKGQAVQELTAADNVNKADLARRTGEILEQRREVNMPGSTEAARDFALRTAYLNEPYGFLGLIATGVRGVLESARRKYPVFGTAAKTQIPFTTVVANILNEKLNWSPAGLVRAAVSHKTGELYGRPIMTPNERAQLYTKAILGTIAVGTIATLFGEHIHGNGPAAPQKRKQLAAAGWIPHSIEYHGKYYSYMNTPLALPLAVIGNTLDWHRYGKGDGADSVSRAAFAMKATANAIVSQGMLDSVKRFFDAMGSESTSEGADKLQKLTARTAAAAVIPSVVQQVDRLFDPTVYDQTGMRALVTGQIPFVRRENKPALTVLGDPVQSGPFHYWASSITTDPLLRTLADRQLWIPEPARDQIVGDAKRGPDYSRALTADEFYQFVAESGRTIRGRLTDNLDQLQGLEHDKAQALINKIAAEERQTAKKSFQ